MEWVEFGLKVGRIWVEFGLNLGRIWVEFGLNLSEDCRRRADAKTVEGVSRNVAVILGVKYARSP